MLETAIAISKAYLIFPCFWRIFDDIIKAYRLSGSRFNIELARAKALYVVYYKSEYA